MPIRKVSVCQSGEYLFGVTSFGFVSLSANLRLQSGGPCSS